MSEYVVHVTHHQRIQFNKTGANQEEFGDLMKAGVIDPTKVTRVALQNASSVAALLLMTEATIVEKPEEKKTSPMPPGGMGGGMY